MSKISFVFRNKIHTIDFSEEKKYKPTTTVLNYLRSLADRKSVKEGCGEGDCGACTLVIADLDGNNKIQYRAYTSCLIFLPMLHGKQLITIEDVGNSKNLHPVQKEMIEANGSQCGFCTPGFIMSIFALYKNTNNPAEEEILDALTGNLCRCTGYRPIIEAAKRACVHNGKDHFTEKEAEVIKMLQKIKNQKDTIDISTENQKYLVPFTLKEALELRKKYPEAILTNGASDVALRVTKKRELLPLIIDLSQVSEIKKMEETKNDYTIGAGLSLEDLRLLGKKDFPALSKMLDVFGSRQIRNRATLGGNIGGASPIGDMPPVLMAYDAIVIVENLEEKREIKLSEFVTAYHQTQLKDDEIIVGVKLKKEQKYSFINSYKISKRKDLDISTVSLGASIKLENNKIEEINLFYGGMAALTKRAAKVEAFLKDKEWTRENVEQALPLADEDFTPISDARSEAEGRQVMARNLILKFWSDCQ